MRPARRLLLLLLGAAMLAESPAAASFDAFVVRTKASLMTNPQGAIAGIHAARRKAAAIADPRRRALAVATTQWLEGEALVRLDRLDAAEKLIDQADRSVAQLAAHSRLKADILRSRGGLRTARVKVAAALADFQAAFRVYRELGDRRLQAITLLDIAFLYSEAKDHESVLRYMSQARTIYNGDAPVLLSVYNNRADALKELGRFGEAQAQFREALVLARQLKSPLLEAQVFRNIARTQLAAGNGIGASRSLANGVSASSRGGAENDQATLALAARVGAEAGRLHEAEALIARSFAGVDLTKTTLSSREAHETAYRIYRERGDDAIALRHLAALKRLDDEATKLATTTGTALMAARFDFANQELRIASLQRDEARRSVAFERAKLESQRLLFTGGAIAVALILFLMSVGLFTIRRSRNQVRHVASDLSISNGALAKALAAKTEFLATTSHEIRTPLNGILGMTEVMLAGDALEPQLRDRLGVVHSAGVTMRALVDDILDVAKMETGNLTLESAPFDLRETLAGAARLWEDQAAAKGIGLRVALDDCPACIEGDAARVRQLAFNLLSNAVKFTRAGEVGLTAQREGDRLIIAVSDTGIGIAADKLDEIFESFRQADAGTTRQFGGTGLGLAICRSLCTAMDGTITVASTPGQGATFTVSLPYRPAAVAETVAVDDAAMLVMERNPIAQAMLRALFVPQGVALVFANDLASACERLSAGGIVRVLADEGTLAREGEAGTALAALAEVAAGVPVAVLATSADLIVPDGCERIDKPIAGERLVARLCRPPSIASVMDPLASRAA